MNLFSYIKQRVPIVSVVGEYTTLKKAGMYWKGCCPFHHERTASFTVTPHKEIFYCFGCHEGGDVISFMAKIEHCSPIDAARHLVERHGIVLPEDLSWDKKTESFDVKKSYYKTCEVFALWCHAQLQKNALAESYLNDRSISSESKTNFQLGYCSTDVRSLLQYAQKEGILAQNFIDAHILKEGKMGLYLSFDERIIFPIHDHLGHTVGFGGRVFKPHDDRAKYYNSQDHALFNKGTLLFGLDKAKKSIAQKETVFLVEGYTDLIMMHQYGYNNTVATLGTACTVDHLKQLSHYAEKVYVMYDGDSAGQNAIMRLAELCWEVSLDPYVLVLPKDEDPASYLMEYTSLEKPLTEAHDIFSYVIHHLADDFKDKSLQGKVSATTKILELINSIADPLKRDLLLQQASERFKVPLETLRSRAVPQKRIKTAEKSTVAAKIVASSLEKKLFSVILSRKDVLKSEDETLLGLLLDAPLKKVFDAWLASKNDKGTDLVTLFERLDEPEKAFISQCITEEEPSEQHLLDPAHLTQIYKKQWKKKVHDVKLRIEEAGMKGERDQVAQLLSDLNTLKTKMLVRGIS
jgi:DNA primase